MSPVQFNFTGLPTKFKTVEELEAELKQTKTSAAVPTSPIASIPTVIKANKAEAKHPGNGTSKAPADANQKSVGKDMAAFNKLVGMLQVMMRVCECHINIGICGILSMSCGNVTLLQNVCTRVPY